MEERGVRDGDGGGRARLLYQRGKEWFTFQTLIVVVITIEMLFTSGVIYGWSPMSEALQNEGAYHKRCPVDTPLDVVCAEQRAALNRVYIIGATCGQFIQLPAGFLLDKIGARYTRVVAAGVFALGSVIFAISPTNPTPAEDGFSWGYAFIGIGSQSLFVASLQLSNIMPQKYQHVAITVFNGAFDASSVIFYFFLLSGVPRMSGFIAYVIVPVFVIFTSLFLINKSKPSSTPPPLSSLPASPPSSPPTSPIKSNTAIQLSQLNTSGDVSIGGAIIGDDYDDYPLHEVVLSDDDVSPPTTPTKSSPESGQQKVKKFMKGTVDNLNKYKEVLLTPRKRTSPIEEEKRVPLKDREIKEQLLSKEFILGAVFFSIVVLRCNYYIGVVHEQLIDINPEEADGYVRLFNILLPVGGVVSIPFIGIILQKLGVLKSMYIINVASIVFSFVVIVPILPLQVIAFIIFVFLRTFVYSALASFVVEFFGFARFGRLFGSIMLVAAVVGLLQYLFVYLNFNHFGGNLVYIDAALLVSQCVVLIIPIMITKIVKRSTTLPIIIAPASP